VLVAHACNPRSDQEAEIRRTEVKSQPGKIVQETLSQKTKNKQKTITHKKRAGGMV
jgi:hypothetical protein